MISMRFNTQSFHDYSSEFGPALIFQPRLFDDRRHLMPAQSRIASLMDDDGLDYSFPCPPLFAAGIIFNAALDVEKHGGAHRFFVVLDGLPGPAVYRQEQGHFIFVCPDDQRYTRRRRRRNRVERVAGNDFSIRDGGGLIASCDCPAFRILYPSVYYSFPFCQVN
jgi:hypothetical protein